MPVWTAVVSDQSRQFWTSHTAKLSFSLRPQPERFTFSSAVFSQLKTATLHRPGSYAFARTDTTFVFGSEPSMYLLCRSNPVHCTQPLPSPTEGAVFVMPLLLVSILLNSRRPEPRRFLQQFAMSSALRLYEVRNWPPVPFRS